MKASKVVVGSDSKSLRDFSGKGFASQYFSLQSPIKKTGNEDGLAILEIDDQHFLFAVTDGLGGHMAGDRASEITLLTFEEKFSLMNFEERRAVNFGSVVVECFEEANRRVLREIPGSGTTLVVGLVESGRLKSFHAGDSELLVFDSEFRLKYRTKNHGPVSELIHSGEISEEDALFHDERHLVVNVIGDPEMVVDIGPPTDLDSGDFLLLSSDGLFDNYSLKQLMEIWQGESLKERAESLRSAILKKYDLYKDDDEESEEWAKADDMTFLLSQIL